jgi:hypothetical protein
MMANDILSFFAVSLWVAMVLVVSMLIITVGNS